MAIQMWYIIRWILRSYIDAFKIPSSASLERSASKLILSSAVLLISVYIHVYRWYLISSLHWVYDLWVQTIKIVKKAPYSSTTLRENAFTIVSLLRATNKTILHDITSTYTIGLVYSLEVLFVKCSLLPIHESFLTQKIPASVKLQIYIMDATMPTLITGHIQWRMTQSVIVVNTTTVKTMI